MPPKPRPVESGPKPAPTRGTQASERKSYEQRLLEELQQRIEPLLKDGRYSAARRLVETDPTLARFPVVRREILGNIHKQERLDAIRKELLEVAQRRGIEKALQELERRASEIRGIGGQKAYDGLYHQFQLSLKEEKEGLEAARAYIESNQAALKKLGFKVELLLEDYTIRILAKEDPEKALKYLTDHAARLKKLGMEIERKRHEIRLDAFLKQKQYQEALAYVAQNAGDLEAAEFNVEHLELKFRIAADVESKRLTRESIEAYITEVKANAKLEAEQKTELLTLLYGQLIEKLADANELNDTQTAQFIERIKGDKDLTDKARQDLKAAVQVKKVQSEIDASTKAGSDRASSIRVEIKSYRLDQSIEESERKALLASLYEELIKELYASGKLTSEKAAELIEQIEAEEALDPEIKEPLKKLIILTRVESTAKEKITEEEGSVENARKEAAAEAAQLMALARIEIEAQEINRVFDHAKDSGRFFAKLNEFLTAGKSYRQILAYLNSDEAGAVIKKCGYDLKKLELEMELRVIVRDAAKQENTSQVVLDWLTRPAVIQRFEETDQEEKLASLRALHQKRVEYDSRIKEKSLSRQIIEAEILTARGNQQLTSDDRQVLLAALYALLLEEIFRSDSKNGVSQASAYLEANKAAMVKDIGQERYDELVENLKKAKENKEKLDRLNDLVKEGKIKEALAYARENREVFGGKIESPPLRERIDALIEEGKFEEARQALKEASLGMIESDSITAYIELFEDLYHTYLIITLNNLPSGWTPPFNIPPELTDRDIITQQNELSRKVDSRPPEEQIREIQRLLSGIPVPDAPGQNYLAGNYTPGKMDRQTTIALLMFMNRNAMLAPVEADLSDLAENQGKTKTLHIPFTRKILKTLRGEYAKYNQDIPLNRALAQTRLGLKVIKLGEGTSAADVSRSDFIWYMLQFVAESYVGNQRIQDLISRLETALFGAGTLAAADIHEFGRLCNTITIDKKAEKKLKRLLEEKNPSQTVSEFPTIQISSASGQLSVGEGAASAFVTTARGEVFLYSPASSILRQPIAYWKSIFLNQMGGTLASNHRGDQIMQPYFEGEDFTNIADYLAAGTQPAVHYPIFRDKAMIAKLEALYQSLPAGQERDLAEKLLGWDPRRTISKELGKTDISGEKKRILKGLLREPADQLEAAFERYLKSSDLSPEDKLYLEALRREIINNNTIRLTVNEQLNEHRLLGELTQEHPWLKPVLESTRPDSLLGASPAEITGLRELASAYAGKRVDIDTLTTLDAQGNRGAMLLLYWIKGDRRGMAEVQKAWYDVALSMLDMGLAATPSTQKLAVLKRKYAQEKGLISRARELRSRIEALHAEIVKYQEKAASLDPVQKARLADLLSQRAALQGELDNIYSFIDGEAITSNFIQWLSTEYFQTSTGSRFGKLIDRMGEGEITGSLEAYSDLVRSGLNAAAAPVNQHLFQMYYVDVVTGEQRTLSHAIEILRTADTRLREILGENYDLRGLFSLNLNSEGLNLTPEQLQELMQIKQAFSAFINLSVDFETIEAFANSKAAQDSVLFMLGVCSTCGNTADQLKMLAMGNYRFILRDRDPDAYFRYVTEGSATKALTKIDLEIVAAILEGIGEKELAQKLEDWRKNRSDLWDENGHLRTDHKEVKETIAALGIKLQDAGYIAVGEPGRDTEVAQAGWSEYFFADAFPLLLNGEYRETFLRNLEAEGFDISSLASLPADAPLHLIAQQIYLRTLMPVYIYLGLPINVIRELVEGGDWEKASKEAGVAIALWSRWAPLWYKQVWTELEQGHVATAVAMYWAVNYIAARGGWASIWGRTLTMDAEVIKFLRMFPGFEKHLPKRYKGVLRYGVDRAAERAGQSGWWQRHGRSGYVRYPLHVLWGINSPWHWAETQIMSLDTMEMTGWRKRIARGAQKGIGEVNYALDYVGYQMGYRVGQVGTALEERADRQSIESELRRIRGIEETGRLRESDQALGRKFVEKGGNLISGSGKVVAELRIINGNVEPTGMGSLEGNLTLADLVSDARDRSGSLSSLNQNGELSINLEIEGEVRSLRIAEVTVTEGATTAEVLNHGLLDPSDWTVRLVISNEELSHPERLQQSLENINGLDIRASHGHQVVRLAGTGFEASPEAGESQRLLDALEEPAKRARMEGTQIDYNAPDFWEKFIQKARDFKTGSLDVWKFRSWIVAANRRAYADAGEGERILFVEQLKTLALFDVDTSENYRSTLLQASCGQGKSFPTLFSALQVALRGQTAYIHTTGKDLVRQMATLAQEPGLKVLLELERAGMIKIWVDDGSVKDPQRRAQKYREADVVVQSHAQHAFDLGDPAIRRSIRAGIIIGDEVDKPAVEDSETGYIKSGERGIFDNPIVSRAEAKKYRAKWDRAYKLFQKMLGAGAIESGNNSYLRYNKSGALELTADGIQEMKTELELPELDAFTLRQFEQFMLAHELWLEDRVAGYKQRKQRLDRPLVSTQYKYIVQDGDIIFIGANGEKEAGKRFGGGLDEALRKVYGLKVEAEHITLSEMTLKDVWRFHRAVMGLSGTVRENYEFLMRIYPEQGFRMIDMPNFMPEVRVTPELLQNPQALVAELERAIGSRDITGFDNGRKGVQIKAKLVLDGVAPDDPNLAAFLQQADTLLERMEVDINVVTRNPRTPVHSAKEALRLAAGEAAIEAARGRPVLLCVENLEDVKTAREFFKDAVSTLKEQGVDVSKIESRTFTAHEASPKKVSKLLEWAREGGHVLINTRASRGTNIPASKRALFEVALDHIKAAAETVTAREGLHHIFGGGMHVISVDPGTEAKETQQEGRAPRAELPGSSTTYISTDSPIMKYLTKPELAELRELLTRDQGNSTRAQELVTKAFQESYQATFQRAHATSENSTPKAETFRGYAELSGLMQEGNGFVPEIFRWGVSNLFEGIEVDPEQGLTEAQVRILESRLSLLMGRRKVDLKALRGASHETALQVLCEKTIGLFERTRAARRLIADGAALHEQLTEKAKLRQMLGKRWAEFYEAVEAAQRESVYNDQPDRLRARVEALRGRLFNNIIRDVFEWAFRKTWLGKTAETVYSWDRMSLTVTVEEARAAKPAPHREAPRPEAPVPAPTLTPSPSPASELLILIPKEAGTRVNGASRVITRESLATNGVLGDVRYIVVAEGARVSELRLPADFASNGGRGKPILYVGADGNINLLTVETRLQQAGISRNTGIDGTFNPVLSQNPVLFERFVMALRNAGFKGLTIEGGEGFSASHLEALTSVLENPHSELRRNILMAADVITGNPILREGLRIFRENGEFKAVPFDPYASQRGYVAPAGISPALEISLSAPEEIRALLLEQVERLDAPRTKGEQPAPKEVVEILRSRIQQMTPEELRLVDLADFQNLAAEIRTGSWKQWFEKGTTLSRTTGEEILRGRLSAFLTEAEAGKVIEGLRWRRLRYWHGEVIADTVRRKIESGEIRTQDGRTIRKLGDLSIQEYRTLLDRIYQTSSGNENATTYLRETWHFNDFELLVTSERTRASEAEYTERQAAPPRPKTPAPLPEPGIQTPPIAGEGEVLLLDETGTVRAVNEMIEQAKRVAREIGMPESMVEGIRTEADAERLFRQGSEFIGRNFGEKFYAWLKTEKGRAFLESERGLEFIRYMAEQNTGSRTTERIKIGANLAISMLAFLGIEEIMDIIGVENKSARFALVISGAHALTVGSHPVVNRLLTQTGRSELTTFARSLSNPAYWQARFGVENFRTAVWEGIKTTRWAGGTVKLIGGLGYAFMAARYYNCLLDLIGVGHKSFWRGEFMQFGVAMVGPSAGGWLGARALGSRLAGAASPYLAGLAWATLYCNIPNIILPDADMEVFAEVKDRVQVERLRQADQEGKWWLYPATFISEMFCLGGLNHMAIAQDHPEVLEEVLLEHAQRASELAPHLRTQLQGTMLQDVFAYQGEAQSYAFFTDEASLIGTLASSLEALEQEIEFKNYRPVIGTTTETRYSKAGGDYWPVTVTVNQYADYEAGEEDAFEFLANNRSPLSEDELKTKLRDEFHITDVEGFLRKVNIKFAQMQFAWLRGTRTYADSDTLKEIFTKEGRLRSGKARELAAWAMGRSSGESLETLAGNILTMRRIARMKKLMEEENPTLRRGDYDLGFVNSDGTINTENEYYKMVMQARALAFLQILDGAVAQAQTED